MGIRFRDEYVMGRDLAAEDGDFQDTDVPEPDWPDQAGEGAPAATGTPVSPSSAQT